MTWLDEIREEFWRDSKFLRDAEEQVAQALGDWEDEE